LINPRFSVAIAGFLCYIVGYWILAPFFWYFSHILKAELSTKTDISPRFFRLVFFIFASFGTFFQSPAQIQALVNGQPLMKGIDTGIHPDSPTRTKIDLNGDWSYSLDGETWDAVRLPAAVDREGEIQFRRRFNITDSLFSFSSFKLVAFGVNYDAEVFINEVFVGRHIGGYTSFEFEIPDEALQLGQENVVKLIVRNQLTGRTTLPVRQQVWGWKNYAGVLRDLFIVASPRAWIDRLHVRTDVDDVTGNGVIFAQAVLAQKPERNVRLDTLSGAARTFTANVLVELVDRFSGTLITPPSVIPAILELNKNLPVQIHVVVPTPKRWSPETPDAYLLRVSIVSGEGKTRQLIDQTSALIGFVSVRFSGPDIIVNGKKVPLKGVVWHEDAPQTGSAVTYEQMERDVVMIRSLGANAIRFAFHPPHQYMLNLCVRYGLFALVEIPVWNVPAEVLTEESFILLAEQQLREAIERDQSSPAVIAWGIGHEFDNSDDASAAFVRRMRDVIRAIDPRPVYAGSVLLTEDKVAGELDIAAITLPTADLKQFKHYLTDWKIAHPRKPIWILGYGKDVDHRNRNGYNDPLSQEAQARYFLQFYGVIKEAAISGSFIDAFSDWRGDRPILTVPVEDRALYPRGLVSANREKRAAYEMVRVLYNEEKISALPAGTFRSSFPIAHVLTGLFVIILVGYQYGYNRRFSEALKRSLVRSYNFFADLRDLHAVSSLHTVILAACISITSAVLWSAILYHFRTDRMFDYVLTFFISSNLVKEWLIWVTWNPFGGIVALTAAFFLGGVVLALLLMIVGMALKARATWFHVYSVSVWGATPVIFLSPVAMSLFKIMENSLYVIPSLVLIALFLGWTFFRVLKGMSVVFDTNPVRTYVGGITLVILMGTGFVLYFDAAFALSSYVIFVMRLVQTIG
jgi:hypothetical protein